ncbi:pyruvate kinase [Drosophila ficusphila]|uniref:pyruvate kinase n=1 Tax=Drosophila ficusphila TaxID=30025 RepID=UPI001C89BD86|nr:pyruvate kinase [Drosophila ficusphila]
MLLELIRAGMRVVRLNFSHGSHEYHCQTIRAARQAIEMFVEQTGLPRAVAIALDTKGPEIRTGKLAGGSEIELRPGETIALSTKKELEEKGTKERLYVDYERLPAIVKPGNRIFVDDGLIALVVKESKGDEVVCQVENGGKLGSSKGVNLPGIPVDLPAITEQDKRDLKFGAEQKVDMVFASFIRNAKAVAEVRQALGPSAKHIKIISKIENQQGLANIDEIIRESDGIMVARGDMGIEIPTEDVPLAQKSIVAKCNKVGKPVICATQMLESMVKKPRPTRAEASDVANAVFDGCDAVMLSGETAKGKYPVECVRCMARICAKVEAVLWYESLQNSLKREIRTTAADHISAITTAIAEAATVAQAKAIVVASPCAMVAQMVSHMRPPCPIVMLSGCQCEAAQTLVFRGVYPLLVDEMVDGSFNFRRIMQSGLKLMAKLDILEPGKQGSVVLVNAMSADKIIFRLITFRQPTVEERDQEERCRQLALEQRCKEKALKESCQKLKREEECRKLQKAEECRRLREAEKCEQMSQADKCREFNENQTVCPKIDDESAKCNQIGEDSKCKLSEENQTREEFEKYCQFAKDQREKLEANKCTELDDAKKCKRLKEAEKCKKLQEAEKCKKLQEAEKCKKLQEAEKCKKIEEAENCKKLTETPKDADCCNIQEEEEKAKLAEEQKKNEAELKIIEEEVAKLEAAAKAERMEKDKKKEAEIKNCKEYCEAKKMKKQDEECKREEKRRKLAELEERWKEVEAKRKQIEEAKFCKKMADEKEKAKAEADDKILNAVCKKLKESHLDPNCKSNGKK